MRTTFKLPRKLKERYIEHVRNTHSITKKSAWVSQAIVSLAEEDPRYAWVGAGDALEKNDASDILTLSKDAKDTISKAIKTLRRIHPAMEGVQTVIIRSAIRKMLAREQAQQKKTA